MSASTEKKVRQAAREAGTDKKSLAAQEEAKKKAQNQKRWTWALIGIAVLIVLVLVLTPPPSLMGYPVLSTVRIMLTDEAGIVSSLSASSPSSRIM